MYDPPGGAVLGGGIGVGGSLALTGFNVMLAVTVGLVLVLVGVLLLRRATVTLDPARRTPQAAPDARPLPHRSSAR